jgi:hypothetical protein
MLGATRPLADSATTPLRHALPRLDPAIPGVLDRARDMLLDSAAAGPGVPPPLGGHPRGIRDYPLPTALLTRSMRRLVHVPILHTSADLGSLSESVRGHYAKLLGETAWSRREEMIEALWADIRRQLEALRLDPHKTRIYQDGLPVCGFEERIVRELAQAGSANHQLVVQWLNQGAAVTGTEDPRLLMEEYELQKRLFEERDRGQTGPPHEQDRADRLLRDRDAFIVARIDATLGASEVGLLFLGALHRLEGLESTDIRRETLADVSSR